jgi:putative SOS response-associated peptidase YedK
MVAAMCGRFVIAADPAHYRHWFEVDEAMGQRLPPNYNVAPTDGVYGVAEHQERRTLGVFRWGLIAPWSARTGPPHINARLETVADKPIFRDSFRRRRCLIPADGFYEWVEQPDGKQPFFIRRTDSSPMAFAGLWSRIPDPQDGEPVAGATIITTAAQGPIRRLHDRMPVMLDRSFWNVWLDRDRQDAAELEAVLRAADSPEVTYHPVSRMVNSVRNNGPACIAPLPG